MSQWIANISIVKTDTDSERADEESDDNMCTYGLTHLSMMVLANNYVTHILVYISKTNNRHNLIYARKLHDQ